MKKILVPLLLFTLSLYCQDKTFEDSLNYEIAKASDKNKVNQYIILARYYTKYSPEKAIETSRKGIELAKKYKSEKTAQFYMIINQNFSAITEYDSAKYYCDLALNFYKTQNDTDGICNTLLNIGINYDILGEQERALDYYKRAETLATKLELDEILAAVYINSGVIFMSQLKYKEALEEYLKALSIDEKSQNPKNLINSYLNLASVLMATNNYEKASEYYFQALTLAEKTNDDNNLFFIHNDLAILYKQKKDYKKSLEQIDQAILKAKKINQKLQYSFATLEKIDLLIKMNNFRPIESLFENIYEDIFNLNSPELRSHFYDQKSNYSIALSQYQEALEYHNLSVQNLQNFIYNPLLQLEHQIRFSKIISNLDRTDEAIQLLETVISNCQGSEKINIKIQAYKELYRIYEVKNNYKKAFENILLYSNYSDSLIEMQKKSNIEELEIIYQIQHKNQENELFKKENQIAAAKLKFQKSIITTMFIISFFIVNLIVIIIIILINKRKGNEKLKKQNEIINNQKNELEKIIASKDRLYSIIGHDLYNAHSNISSFINVLKRNMKNMNVEFISKLTTELTSINNNSLNLLNALVEWGKIQTKKQTFNPTKFNLKALFHTNLMHFKKNIDDKNIQIKNNIDNDLTIFADKNMMGTIIRNLISNGIKFTPKNGEISICSAKFNSSIQLKIKDTGIGINQETLEKLFKIEETISTQGTFGEKGHGLGLIICKELVEIHKGEISIQSQPHEGTTILINLPILNSVDKD